MYRVFSHLMGLRAAVSVYHAWMLGHGEPDALFGGTVVLSNWKQKGSWTRLHTPIRLARAAETGNPAFGCEMTDYNLEQSAAHRRVGTSPEGGRHVHWPGQQLLQNSSLQFSSQPRGVELPLNLMHDSPQVLVLIFNFIQACRIMGTY